MPGTSRRERAAGPHLTAAGLSRVSRRRVLAATLTLLAGGAGAALAACAEAELSEPPAPPAASRPSPAPPSAPPPPPPAATRASPRPPLPSPSVRTPQAGVVTPGARTVPTQAPSPAARARASPTEVPSPVARAPAQTPEPTARPRPGQRVAPTPEPEPPRPPGAPEIDGLTVASEFTEARIWRHWEAARDFFTRGLDPQGATEFRSAVAVAFGHGRVDIGEYLASEGQGLVRERPTADRLAALDVGGPVVSWLPAPVRERLRAQANILYRDILDAERDTVDPAIVATLLGQIRTIRNSSGLLGVHWPDPTRTYRDGTPFVERVVSRAETGVEYHREQVRVRVSKLRARHPLSPIILRVDYRPGQAIPRNEAERAEYYPMLEGIIKAEEFQGLILQQGNEPQFDGNPTPDEIAREFNGWGTADTDTGNFWTHCDIFNPTALRLPMPIAPFHPDGPAQPNPAGVEDSPWARMAYQSKQRLLEYGKARGRIPHGWAEHVYGDPLPGQAGADREAWRDLRDPRTNFRWGMNVAETWHEINGALERAFGLTPLPVWVTEFNTAARGTRTPFRPADNYVPGWMIHATAQMATRLPTLQGACWFVADSYFHDLQWAQFALHEGKGRTRDAERDFETLQRAGV